MLINPEGSPFYLFRHYATFFERKKFFKNFNFFPKNIFCAFRALDMARTLDVPVLFISYFFKKFHIFKPTGDYIFFEISSILLFFLFLFVFLFVFLTPEPHQGKDFLCASFIFLYV